MSLDIELYSPSETVKCVCECGHVHTREHEEIIYSVNITHNLGGMAEYAGIYKCLWQPEKIGITNAGQLIAPLTQGLAKLKAKPKKCRRFEPENGWGTYEDLVSVVSAYLSACQKFPGARVRVSC